MLSSTSYRLGRSLLAASLTVSAFFLSSHSIIKNPEISSSKWDNGSCSFISPYLSYSSNHNHASIKVDNGYSKDSVSQVKKILCSPLFTVLVSEDAVFVTLGADQILKDGASATLGGRFGLLNSYSINISKFEHSTAMWLSHKNLYLKTDSTTFSIDLSDPYGGWSIY